MDTTELYIKRDKQEVGERLQTILNNLYNQSSVAGNGFNKPEDWAIYIPAVAMDFLTEYWRSMGPNAGVKFVQYRGVKILDGYEPAIVIAHRRAVDFTDSKLVFKASI